MYINLVCALNHVPTLWDPKDCSSSGSSVYGILRAGILESVAIPFSRGWNPGLLHCRSILYRLSHQGSPCKSFLTAYFYCCCLVAKLCPTLQTHGLYSPPGSSVHGISQARILEWVTIAFSRESSQPRDQTHISWISCIAGQFFTTEPPAKLISSR